MIDNPDNKITSVTIGDISTISTCIYILHSRRLHPGGNSHRRNVRQSP